MIKPVSLFWIPVLLVRGFHYSMFTGVTPLIGSGEVGWSEETVTSVVGAAQLLSGVIGLTLGGLPMMFALVFALHLLGLVLMLVVKFPRRSVSLESVAK